jgi:hypothetical protein
MTPTNPTEKARFAAFAERLTEAVGPQLQRMAERLGVTPQYLSNWRNPANKRGPQPGWEAAAAAEARAGAESYRAKAADLDALAAELEEAAAGRAVSR